MTLQVQKIYMLTGKSLTADFNSPDIDVSQWKKYSIQVIKTAAGTSAGNFKIQVTDLNTDTTYFNDYPSSTKAFDSATDVTAMWEFTTVGHEFVRVVWDNTSGAGGTVDIIAFLKTE